MAFWKKKFDTAKADEIAAKAADFFQQSLHAMTKRDRNQTDVDVSFAFAFGIIDMLAQQAGMGDTESVGKITMCFLVKHLGIEPEASFEQLLQMARFSESRGGLNIMRDGANAYLHFARGDLTAVSILNELIAGDYFTSR